MKTLILVRHAKSSWNDPAQRDIDRPLNERGRNDAPMMAERLLKRDIHPQRILCSPALRTVRQKSLPSTWQFPQGSYTWSDKSILPAAAICCIS